ncbi:right-handed parallel beta-helix repeat-containing protein [Gemmobacter denitrificans]|uniref:Right-handed parallel beta-helix repeat-containing protein n=1 Tax=Gemmobacter denitrificans TaxID=3123040 RepID=A0ABU8BPC5_9RHOB
MKPKGFWSYARGDDDHLDKMLSDLRGVIAGEVSMLMGEEVGIFQDIHDLRTGDRWAETLRAGVSAASFLIPVLTPRFFNRDWCREEVLTYLRICEETGIEPRIFPIRFVKWREDADCVVRQALQPFQYKDFSNWRFESDPTQKSRLVFEFAEDVTERLHLPPAARKPAKPSVGAAHEPQTQKTAEEIDLSRKEEMPPPKQPVHIVDPWPKRGDFTSIQAAIDAAEPGDRILVREGTYRESLRLSKVLEIFGEGDRERILVTTDKGNALQCDAPLARIAGLRFRRDAGGKNYGIWISGGGAEIEDCVVESLSLACIAIEGSGTAPSLRRCLLRDGEQAGLFVLEGAQPVVEDCQFIGNAFSAVEVEGQVTRPTLRRCVASHGKAGGFFFHEGAGGVMEGCEGIGNAYTGVEIKTGAAPLLRDCTLRDNMKSGLFVHENGRGRVEGGQITGNGIVGVSVGEGSTVTVTGCTITDNTYEAVWVKDDDSTGTFRNNDLRGNRLGAWDIAEGAKVERHGNME